ncbi:MAG: folate-binding protein YgfZ [Synechococcaceae cyanobacterium SM2_3_1]|nr:folate-binding protein YgfZ [Synechococcaceae cyanobacterium SM2_3_1]
MSITSSPLPVAADREAWREAHESVAVFDRSHWGRLRLTGEGALGYLHNQSTQDLHHLSPGQGADTVFVTAAAHMLDLTTVYVQDTDVLLLTSPQRRQFLTTTLSRFLPFLRTVQLTDETEATMCFSLVGPASSRCLEPWLGESWREHPLHHHLQIERAGLSVTVAKGSGLSGEGFTLCTSATEGLILWQQLSEMGVIPGSQLVWEQLRIADGRPTADQELTEAYNPLEAGLWQAVSLSKGCYIGQEVLAKQVTYKRIRQQLWGLRLEALQKQGTEIFVGEDKIGTLTSSIETLSGVIGLAYVRTKFHPQTGMQVQVGDIAAELIHPPFLSYPPA